MSDPEAGPFADALEAPDFAADEQSALTKSQLMLTQGIASQQKPDVAARALKRMAETGAPFPTAVAEAQKPPSWEDLAKDSPYLAKHLVEDANRAAALSDDVENLGRFEKWLGGWQDSAWAAGDEWTRTGRMMEGGFLGWEKANAPNGRLSPEKEARLAELEREDALNPPLKHLGYAPKYLVAGTSQALHQQAGAFARHQGEIVATGVAGAATAGALAVAASGPAAPVTAGPAMAVGFFKGLGVGQAAMSMYDNGRLEGGNFYREAIKLPGVTHESAMLGARFVALANGSLEGVEAKVIGLIPGAKLIMGSEAKNVLLRILGTQSGKMAFVRFAGRVASSGFMEGAQEAMQEFVTIYEGLRSSPELDKGSLGSMREAVAGKDPLTGEPYWNRLVESWAGGVGMGVGMGGPHVIASTWADAHDVQAAKQRVKFYEVLGGISTDSRTRERLPGELKVYINRVMKENGGVAPESISAPAGQLKTVLQEANLSPAFVAKEMPEVARQLEAAGEDPNVEVAIPMADFATHIAPLNGYKTLQQDLRVGRGLTLREALRVEKRSKELEDQVEPVPGAERTPAEQVFDVVRQQSRDLGHSEDSARKHAALWASVMEARGSRTGKDALTYFQGVGLQVQHTQIDVAQLEAFRAAQALKREERRAAVAAKGEGPIPTPKPPELVEPPNPDQVEAKLKGQANAPKGGASAEERIQEQARAAAAGAPGAVVAPGVQATVQVGGKAQEAIPERGMNLEEIEAENAAEDAAQAAAATLPERFDTVRILTPDQVAEVERTGELPAGPVHLDAEKAAAIAAETGSIAVSVSTVPGDVVGATEDQLEVKAQPKSRILAAVEAPAAEAAVPTSGVVSKDALPFRGMKFARGERSDIPPPSSRRLAAAEKAVEADKERAAGELPGAAKPPRHQTAEERVAAIDASNKEHWDSIRAHQAKTWREARARLRAMSPAERAIWVEAWNKGGQPKTATYLAEFLRNPRPAVKEKLAELAIREAVIPKPATVEAFQAWVATLPGGRLGKLEWKKHSVKNKDGKGQAFTTWTVDLGPVEVQLSPSWLRLDHGEVKSRHDGMRGRWWASIRGGPVLTTFEFSDDKGIDSAKARVKDELVGWIKAHGQPAVVEGAPAAPAPRLVTPKAVQRGRTKIEKLRAKVNAAVETHDRLKAAKAPEAEIEKAAQAMEEAGADYAEAEAEAEAAGVAPLVSGGGLLGSEGVLRTQAFPAGERVVYAVVDSRNVLPSHSPTTFQTTSGYPAEVQTRNYATSEVEKTKVREGGKDPHPDILLTNDPGPINGPPMVTAAGADGRHLVMGGNGRTMIMQLAFLLSRENLLAYKAELIKVAGMYGLDPKAIEAMDSPMLVRIMPELRPTSDKTALQDAVKRTNEGMQLELDDTAKAVADARALTPEALQAIGALLADTEGTVRDLLSSRPAEVRKILEDSKIINNTNRATYMKGAEFTELGKARIEGMFLGRIIGTGDRMAATSKELRKKLERAVVHLLRVEGVNPDASEIQTVQAAIDLQAEASRRGVLVDEMIATIQAAVDVANDAKARDIKLADVVDQATMFDVSQPVPPAIAAMAKLLEGNGQVAVGQRFKAWASVAGQDPTQGTMFGLEPTKENAREELLGPDVNAKVLFQRVMKPGPENLLVQHNLTAENLIHADELGGLAMPSISISRKEHPQTTFGEITLLAAPELVDPKGGTPVFDADAYTPRHPDVKYRINPKAKKALEARFGSYLARVQGSKYLDTQALHEYGITDFSRFRDTIGGLRLAYIETVLGEKLPDYTKAFEPKRDISRTDAIQAFIKENGARRDFRPDDEYHVKLTAAVRAAIDEVVAKALKTSQENGNEYGPLDAEDLDTIRKSQEQAVWGGWFSKADPEEIAGLVPFSVADSLLNDASRIGEVLPDREKLRQATEEKINGTVHESAFEAWAKEQLSPVVEKPYMRVWTDQGNERRIPYTLENIVRMMKRDGIRGGEGHNYGLGTARAHGAMQFRSIAGIQKARDRIVSFAEEEKVKKDLNDRFQKLAEEANLSLQGLSETIIDAYKMGIPRALATAGLGGRSARHEGLMAGDTLEASAEDELNTAPDWQNRLRTFMADLVAAPTEYFEAKPRRAVELSEFKAAVVPAGLDPRARAILERHGLTIYDFTDYGDEKMNRGAREAAIAQAAGTEKILFQPSFHGTGVKGITKLDSSKIGTGQGAAAYGWGHYSAEDPGVARQYYNELSRFGLVTKTALAREGDPTTGASSQKELALVDLDNRVRYGHITSPGEFHFELKDWQRKIELEVGDAYGTLTQIKEAFEEGQIPEPERGAPAAPAQDDVYDAQNKLDAIQELNDWAQKLTVDDFELLGGQIYQLTVPDKTELFDWDLGLVGQTPFVTAKLEAAGAMDLLDSMTDQGYLDDSIGHGSYITGEQFYKGLAGMFSGLAPSVWLKRNQQIGPTNEERTAAYRLASMWFKGTGIDGLMYLDGNSRHRSRGGPTGGTHNFVVWNDEAIRIDRTLYQGQQKDNGPALVVDLKKAGNQGAILSAIVAQEQKIRGYVEKGLNVVIPVPPAMTGTIAQFWSDATAQLNVLGPGRWVAGVTPEHALEVIRAIRPDRVHIIGVKPGSGEYWRVQESIKKELPDVEFVTGRWDEKLLASRQTSLFAEAPAPAKVEEKAPEPAGPPKKQLTMFQRGPRRVVSDKDAAVMMATARHWTETVASKAFEAANPDPLVAGRVLDFGAGKDAAVTMTLRAKGYTVDAHDLWAMRVPAVRAAGRHLVIPPQSGSYNHILLSNVLNVQASDESMDILMADVKDAMAPGATVTANLTAAPRKGWFGPSTDGGISFTAPERRAQADRLEAYLKQHFRVVERTGKADGMLVLRDPIKVALPAVVQDVTADQALEGDQGPLFQRGSKPGSPVGVREDYRGSVSFDEATRNYFKITLTGKANLSTFLHESGHVFLELLRRDAKGGHAESQADLAVLLEWMGVKDDAELVAKSARADAVLARVKAEHRGLTEEEQAIVDAYTVPIEKFARGFEAYLMEGKAPTSKLEEAFASFAAWLRHVYTTIRGLDVELTDEVRGVMDRLVATDEAIKATQAENLMLPMFGETAGESGMNGQEFTAYRAMWNKAIAARRHELEREVMREFKASMGEEADKVRAEQQEILNERPDFNAWAWLTTGARLDGAEVATPAAKLSLAGIKALNLGKKAEQKLKAVMAERGLDLDVAASFLGYADGLDLVKALVELPTMAKALEDATNAVLRDRYPGFNPTAKWLAEKANEHLNSNEVQDALLMELGVLNKKIGENKETGRTLLEAMKIAVRARVRKMTGVELEPWKYRRAAAMAAQEKMAAYGKGDLPAAAQAARQQLWNLQMERQATEAKEAIAKIQRYLNTFTELSVRKRLGLAGQLYLKAIDALLEGIEWKRVSNRTIAERRAGGSLAEYLDGLRDEGALIAIPEELRKASGLRNWKQLTVAELEQIQAAVSNIDTQAKLKNKLVSKGKWRDFQELALSLAASIKAANGDRRVRSTQNPTWWQARMDWLRKGRASLRKIEFLCRMADGGVTAGPFHQAVFQLFRDAESEKQKLSEKIMEPLLAPLQKMTLKERLRLDGRVDFLGTSMRMSEVLALALNVGNEGNLEKLVDGYVRRGWTREAVLARLDELMEQRDWELVQHIWDTIELLWPAIKELQERTVGLAPPKVEARSVATRWGVYRGGYYPVIYDRTQLPAPKRNKDGSLAVQRDGEQIAQANTKDFFESNFLLPNVSKGFTEARTKYAAPILLSLDMVPKHVNEVIHFLTHYEAVRDADRLLQHPDVKEAIWNGLGHEEYNLFRPWMAAIAHNGAINESADFVDSTLRHFRLGSSIVLLGMKFTTGLIQILGLFPTIKELGLGYTAAGIKTFMEQLSRGNPFAECDRESAEMRYITHHFERDMGDLFDAHTSALGLADHYKGKVATFSLAWLMLVQKTVNAITWYGAREKALELEHADPVAYADSVMAMSQSTSGMKDLASIQRGSETKKLFTVMYTFFNVLFNQLAEGTGRKSAKEKIGIYAARFFWLVFLPVLCESLLRNHEPEPKDDKSWVKMLLRENLLYIGRSVPLAGAVADSYFSEYGTRLNPWLDAIMKGARAARSGVRDDRMSDSQKKALIEFIGMATHTPTGGFLNAAKFLHEYSAGKLKEPAADLFLRSPREWE